jgi:hypothetical protein
MEADPPSSLRGPGMAAEGCLRCWRGGVRLDGGAAPTCRDCILPMHAIDWHYLDPCGGWRYKHKQCRRSATSVHAPLLRNPY